jgi:hypothetical protein
MERTAYAGKTHRHVGEHVSLAEESLLRLDGNASKEKKRKKKKKGRKKRGLLFAGFF